MTAHWLGLSPSSLFVFQEKEMAEHEKMCEELVERCKLEVCIHTYQREAGSMTTNCMHVQIWEWEVL